MASLTEAELLNGWQPVGEALVRREVCACGEVIVAPLLATEPMLVLLIRSHNRRQAHTEWRRREGIV